MTSSLEQLLAEEGFKGNRIITRSRSSFHSNVVNTPHYPVKDQQKILSVSDERIRTERTKSDVSQYHIRSKLLNRDIAKSWRPRDNISERKKMDEGLKNKNEEKSSSDSKVSKGTHTECSEHMPRNEIIEMDEQEGNTVKDIYANGVFNAKRGKEKNFNEFREREKSQGMYVKDAKVDKRQGSSSSTHMVGHFIGNTVKNIKQLEKSNNRANSKSFQDSYDKIHDHAMQTPSDLALDEVAVQAVVSILNGYIKRFLKDEDFRTTLRHNCFSSMNFIELEEENCTGTKVVRSLEQAIETIDQAAEDSVSDKDLKRASLQLSFITGLCLNDLKYGLTCGIPNYKLSACAHLYLSVVYKIQRKDKVSAKHLLQVFCDSPTQARTTLLPELWEYLFSPNLSHLKAWYKKEADVVADTPSRTRKLKYLGKVYNEQLDFGTHSFAVYYKDWLTGGAEVPSIPSIKAPSISATGSEQGSSLGHSSELATSIDSFSPQLMVSKKLYDSVFGSLSKPGVDEDEHTTMEDNLDNCSTGSYVSPYVKQTSQFASEMVKYTDQDIEEDFTKTVPVVAFRPQKGTSSTAEEEWREKNLSNEIGNSFISLHTSVNSIIPDALPHVKANEITFREVGSSVLETRNSKSSFDPIVFTVSPSSEESVSNSVVNPTQSSYSLKGLCFPTIPKEFICPLTGTLFEEPTTLENGQTFERAAIKAWFKRGNRTCPVSGNSLDCVTMPLTNLVLKRLVDNWKSEQFSRLLDFASQIVENSRSHKLKYDEAAVFNLESLFSSLNEEEKSTYARQLISLGILSFLFRRFELGNVEEKPHVVALLLNCIEADSSCIYQIARNIDKNCLMEVLHSKEVTQRTNARLLLTELLSLKR